MGKTPEAVANGGRVTAATIEGRMKTASRSLGKFSDRRAQLGSLYDGVTPLTDDAREASLRGEVGMWTRMLTGVRATESAFQQPVELPALPKVLTTDRLVTLRQRGLEVVGVPAFPLKTTAELDHAVHNGSTPVTEVFTKPYLKGVLTGRLPIPDLKGYYLATDEVHGRTPLADALEIGDVYAPTYAGMRRSIHDNGERVVKDLGLDPKTAYVGLVTAKEDLFFQDIGQEDPDGKRSTRTQVNGRGTRLIVKGKELEENIAPQDASRLVVVFKPRRAERYLTQ